MTEPRVDLPEMDLVLPGSWWTVDLDDEASARRSIHALAERLVGPQDDRALLRAEIRTRMTAVVDQARTGHAANLYVALELTPGLGVPMSLAVYWPRETILHSRPSDPASLIELIRLGLSSTDSAAAYTDELVEDLGRTSTLRRVTMVRTAAEGEMPAVDTMVVDYWLAVPGTQRAVLLTFSSPFLQARAELLELFRTMVGLIRWTDARTPVATGDAGA